MAHNDGKNSLSQQQAMIIESKQSSVDSIINSMFSKHQNVLQIRCSGYIDKIVAANSTVGVKFSRQILLFLACRYTNAIIFRQVIIFQFSSECNTKMKARTESEVTTHLQKVFSMNNFTIARCSIDSFR